MCAWIIFVLVNILENEMKRKSVESILKIFKSGLVFGACFRFYDVK